MLSFQPSPGIEHDLTLHVFDFFTCALDICSCSSDYLIPRISPCFPWNQQFCKRKKKWGSFGPQHRKKYIGMREKPTFKTIDYYFPSVAVSSLVWQYKWCWSPFCASHVYFPYFLFNFNLYMYSTHTHTHPKLMCLFGAKEKEKIETLRFSLFLSLPFSLDFFC